MILLFVKDTRTASCLLPPASRVITQLPRGTFVQTASLVYANRLRSFSIDTKVLSDLLLPGEKANRAP